MLKYTEPLTLTKHRWLHQEQRYLSTNAQKTENPMPSIPLVGPCLNHYRCYRVYIPSTNSFCIANTVDWFPHNIKMPTANATDILLATAKDLTAALRQHQQNPLLPPPDTQTRHALTKLNEIFSNATKQQEEIPATLPRVPTIQIKTPVTLPRVPATTTEGYLDMTATNRRLRRQKKKPNAQKTKSKKTPKKNNKSKKPSAIQKQSPHQYLSQSHRHHQILLLLVTASACINQQQNLLNILNPTTSSKQQSIFLQNYNSSSTKKSNE